MRSSKLLNVLASLALACPVFSAPTYADGPVQYDLRIEQQSLSTALQEFAKQSGVQIIFFSKVTDGHEAPPLRGKYTASDALQRLLDHSELTFRELNAKTIEVQPKAAVTDSKKRVTEASLAPTSMNEAGEGTRLAQKESTQNTENNTTTETPTSSSFKQDGNVKIEEIIVTAQKREQRLQDVPVPVSVLQADELVEQGQLRLQDYYHEIPGVNLQSDGVRGGPPVISIRGITTGGIGGGSTLGVTIDDVPLTGFVSTPDIDPNGLQRIEVLRGPQGTLYGVSSMGGLLKYVTADPLTEGFKGRVQAGVSGISNSPDLGYNFRASVNLPLADTFAMRASGFTHRDGGYIDNPRFNVDGVHEQEATGGQISALWKPSSSASLKLNALIQDSKSDGASYVTAGLADLQQSAGREIGWDRRRTEIFGATLKANLGQIDLTSVTAYSTGKMADSIDYSSTFWSLFSQGFGVTGAPFTEAAETNQFSQEVRLEGNFGQKVEWLFGAFYTDTKTSWLQWVYASDYDTGEIAGITYHGGLPSTGNGYAGFINLTFQLTDRFDIQLGGRQDQLRSEGSFWYEGVFGSFTGPKTISESDFFTYLVTPRLKVSPNLMLYARVASGFRPGGKNVVVAPDVPEEVEPDTTLNYELGVKGGSSDGALSFDASIYYIDWTKIPVSARSISGLFYTANASAAKSEGVEVSVDARPLEGLRIGAWVAYNSAELTKSLQLSAYGFPGDRLPGSGRVTGNLSLDQEFPLWNNATGFVGGAVTYVDDRVGQFTATAERQVFPAYWQANLRAGMKYESWTVNLFANNLFDERGLLAGGLGTQVPSSFVYIRPRTIGLSLGKSF